MFDDRDQPIEAVPSAPVSFEPTLTQPVAEVPQSSAPAPIETVTLPTFAPASSAIPSRPEPQQQASVAPVAPVAPPVPAAADQVWISREEYQRLQQAQVIASRNPNPAEVKPTKLISKVQVLAAIAAAIALILGLVVRTSFLGGYLIAPSLIILALLGAFTLQDYLKSKKPGSVLKPHKARNRTLLTVAMIVLALPILIPAGFIIMFMIVCAGGGCKGS